MGYRNNIFLDESELDKPIYRICSFGRFIQILTSKELTLVKPKKWDDPFENAFLSSEFYVGHEPVNLKARDSVYGQCWTLHRETDAMWRIYSDNKDGIRLRTTPRKLLNSLRSQVKSFPELRCFIGKVQYKTKKNLETCFSEINITNSNGSGIAETLLYKRKQFSHEKEVRLIYSGDDNNCKDDIFKYQINPSELFDVILFDPRMENALREAYKAVVKNLGYTFKIRRSTLYDPPPKYKMKF